AAEHADEYEEFEPIVFGGFDAEDLDKAEVKPMVTDVNVNCWACDGITFSIYVVAYDEAHNELARTEAFAL
ncbi:MAG: hypothetical protein IJN32_10605, partial [Thermoguttaceae bacterium]|nr:hypothetical protein [Thermoguttaceae bacterium]